jgi:hypothetical protein
MADIAKLLALSLLAACELGSHQLADVALSSEQRPENSALTADAATYAAAHSYVHAARRCGECHESYHEQWRGSAHARASSSPAYLSMRAESNGAACDHCHAPLAEAVGAADPRAREGVSCDACHGIAKVEQTGAGARFSLELQTGTRYGPLCDATDHYFHRMGCSPLHQTSELCAACHTLDWSAPDGSKIPVLSEYAEWKASPFAAQDVPCQYCHMPESRAEVAKGAGPRPSVSHHGFLSDAGDLRQTGLLLELRAEPSSREQVTLHLKLTNRAGHSLPSGFPGRQVVVEARVLEADGQLSDRASLVLARTLGAADGVELPFHRASRVLSDNRLTSRETRREQLTLAAPSAGTIVVEARWRSLSDTLAKQLNDTVSEQTLLSATLQVGPPSKARRISPARVVASPARGASQ